MWLPLAAFVICFELWLLVTSNPSFGIAFLNHAFYLVGAETTIELFHMFPPNRT